MSDKTIIIHDPFGGGDIEIKLTDYARGKENQFIVKDNPRLDSDYNKWLKEKLAEESLDEDEYEKKYYGVFKS